MKKLIQAVMIGSAIGDALGVPVEFSERWKLDRDPVTDMRGYGFHPVPAGAWSDDTSMALCTMDVLADGELDFDRIMVNFNRWYHKDEFTPTGMLFDVGNTCSFAIENYFVGHMPYTGCGLRSERSNGNGSLMRIHPFSLYLAKKKMTDAEKIDVIHTASALTHAHERSKVGCGIFSFVLWEILKKPEKDSVHRGLEKARAFYRDNEYREIDTYADLFSGLADIPRDRIKSTGYVVDTLAAALWCLLTTETYGECVLKAVNLGGDTDTVAAIAGALAGALYGYESIPQEWRDKLIKREWIEEICDKAFENWNKEYDKEKANGPE